MRRAGNRSSHEGVVRDLRITGGAGEYDIDDTGALGAQLVIFENVDVYPHATGLGIRLQDSTVGGAGLRTVYISQGVGLYIHSGGDGTSHMLDLSAWLAVYSGNLVVNGNDADGPALRLREGALLNSERGAGYVRVTGYTTLDNASSFAAAPSIFMPTWEVRTNTASPFQFAGANGVVAVGEVIGSTNLGQVAATLVTGVGALAWTRVEVSGYVDTSASTTTDLLQILAALLAPGAGGGPGLVQVTGGVASQDAGNVDAATWRTALGLEDLAVTERSDLREVTAGGTDGQVLTSDGANGYTWEDASGGGGGDSTSVESSIPVPVLGDMADMTTFGASTALAASTTLADGSLLLQAPDTDDVQTGLGIAVGAGDWTYGAAIGLQYDGTQYSQTYTIRASITFSGDPVGAHVAMGIGKSNSPLSWEGVALTTNSTQAVNWDGWPAHSTRRPQSGRGYSGTVVMARRGTDIHVFYADPGSSTLILLETQTCPASGGAGVVGLTLTNRGSEWNAVKSAAVKMQVHRFGAMEGVPGWNI